MDSEAASSTDTRPASETPSRTSKAKASASAPSTGTHPGETAEGKGDKEAAPATPPEGEVTEPGADGEEGRRTTEGGSSPEKSVMVPEPPPSKTDFLMCIGFLLVLGAICAILVAVIHFTKLKNGLFKQAEYAQSPSTECLQKGVDCPYKVDKKA